MDGRRNHSIQSVEDQQSHDEEREGESSLRSARLNRHGVTKSVEGWNLFVRGLSESIEEGNLMDEFSKFGYVSNIKVHRDRQTGAARNAIVEFGSFQNASDAINRLHGSVLLGQRIEVHWAFVKPNAGSIDLFGAY